MENAAAPGKKRKLDLEDSELPTHLFPLKTRRSPVVPTADSASSVNCEYSTCECVISSDNAAISAVICSSNGSGVQEKIHRENIEEESTGDSLDCRERGETSVPLIEVQADSGELESMASPLESNSRRPFTAEKMPSEDELEDFFAAAERNLQKQFIDKYNFDIVKDEPLDGRYEWFTVNQSHHEEDNDSISVKTS